MPNRKLLSAIIFLSFIPLHVAQTGRPSRVEVEKRVDSILSKMTQEEKIEIIGGINDFYTRPIPRLGIPSLRMSDGPMGVHDYGLTTAYPAGIALAASWDVDLAQRIKRISGAAGEIVFQPLHYADVELRIPNVEKARVELGWEPLVELDEGLQKTIAWYREKTLASA